MATLHTRTAARFMVGPSVILLFIWMIVPLVMTIYYSLLNYKLDGTDITWAGLSNYYYFFTDPAFFYALKNSLLLVAGSLVITLVGGILLALLLDQPFWGQGLAKLVGLDAIDWFAHWPLLSITLIVAWQWLPFATLILLTALQSLSEEQKEAAEMDGAPVLSMFFYIILPHLTRAITVVILIETIFLLSVFAEIQVTTQGGEASSNIPYLVFSLARLDNDIGGASAGGIVAVIIANIVAFFLVRMIGKNLEA